MCFGIVADFIFAYPSHPLNNILIMKLTRNPYVTLLFILSDEIRLYLTYDLFKIDLFYITEYFTVKAGLSFMERPL